jgi:hypothetical protein
MQEIRMEITNRTLYKLKGKKNSDTRNKRGKN